MREIGGYIEFESFRGELLHSDGILLNCGRNALAYLILAREIKKIAIPWFMCETVSELCVKYSVSVRHYHTGYDFLPEGIQLENDEWLYLMDYYGQLENDAIRRIKEKYKRVIVDFAQDYFREPVIGIDAIYTCRKFFGVPDGAILYTDAKLQEDIQQDESFQRMNFLLGRYERNASEYYREYVENNEAFINAPIKKMSKLTQNLLRSIDYKYVGIQREKNFNRLHERLCNLNGLKIHPVYGAFSYPLLLENGTEMRAKLIENKIYVPVLWPNVIDEMAEGSTEHFMAKNILPLPCDQRYLESDMDYIADVLLKLYKGDRKWHGI